MEQKFFDAISDEQQGKSDEFVQKIKEKVTREDIKGSYARRLTERLAALERDKVKP